MIKLKILFLLIFLSFEFFLTIDSYAQTTIHSIGFEIGDISSVDPHSKPFDSEIIIFPEIFISGDFFSSQFYWEVNLGYWDDGIDKPRYNDFPNYSYSSFVLGANLLWLAPITDLDHPSPVRFLAGFSYHFVNAEDIGIYESGRNSTNDFTENLFHFDTGMEIHVLIKNNLTVFFKGVIYFPLNDLKLFPEAYNIRSQLSLGVNYNFRI